MQSYIYTMFATVILFATINYINPDFKTLGKLRILETLGAFGYFDGAWTFRAFKALGHLRHLRAFRYLKETWALKATEDDWVAEGHFDTGALEAIRTLEGTSFSRLILVIVVSV